MHIRANGCVYRMGKGYDASASCVQNYKNGGKDAPLRVGKNVHGRHVVEVRDLLPCAIDPIDTELLDNVHPVPWVVILNEVNRLSHPILKSRLIRISQCKMRLVNDHGDQYILYHDLKVVYLRAEFD